MSLVKLLVNAINRERFTGLTLRVVGVARLFIMLTCGGMCLLCY